MKYQVLYALVSIHGIAGAGLDAIGTAGIDAATCSCSGCCCSSCCCCCSCSSDESIADSSHNCRGLYDNGPCSLAQWLSFEPHTLWHEDGHTWHETEWWLQARHKSNRSFNFIRTHALHNLMIPSRVAVTQCFVRPSQWQLCVSRMVALWHDEAITMASIGGACCLSWLQRPAHWPHMQNKPEMQNNHFACQLIQISL